MEAVCACVFESQAQCSLISMDSEPLQQFGCGVPLNAGVAKIIVVRNPNCGSGCRGFESLHPPQNSFPIRLARPRNYRTGTPLNGTLPKSTQRSPLPFTKVSEPIRSVRVSE